MIASSNVVSIGPAPDPARWIVLDLETGDAPEDAIQAAVANWKAPSNWKPETVEKNRAEYTSKVRDKAALLDASPILCVGIKTPLTAIMFSGMGIGHLSEIQGWSVVECKDEGAMLAAMRGWLDLIAGPDTVLAGHNVRGFDLPKLRGAYVRHRQPLPGCLKPSESGPGQAVTDTMRLFGSFSMEHRDSPFIGLDTVCRAFGIPRPKQVVDGSEVPAMYREGRIAEILTYCAIDVESTAEVYRLMMQ